MEWSEGMALAISVSDVNSADVGVTGGGEDDVGGVAVKKKRGRPPGTGSGKKVARGGRPPGTASWKQKLAPHGQTTKRNGQTCNISTDHEVGAKSTNRYNFRTRGKKATINDISLTEVPISDSSHKITKNLGSNDELNQSIDPKTLQHMAYALQYMVDDPKVKSRTSEFDANLADTLKAINENHGIIMSECSLESDRMKTFVLNQICEVVQDLQKKELTDIDISTLDSFYTVVRDAKSMKVNVEWLLERLDEIRDGVYLADKVKALVGEKKSLLENIDCKKKELEIRKVELDRLRSEFQDMEDELAREHLMVEELNGTIEAQKEKLFALPPNVLFGGARLN